MKLKDVIVIYNMLFFFLFKLFVIYVLILVSTDRVLFSYTYNILNFRDFVKQLYNYYVIIWADFGDFGIELGLKSIIRSV